MGAYIWRGDLTEGFLHYRFGGLIFGGAYTWRGLFSEFYGIILPRGCHLMTVFGIASVALKGEIKAPFLTLY